MKVEVKSSKTEPGYFFDLHPESQEENEFLRKLWDHVPDITFDRRGCVYDSAFKNSGYMFKVTLPERFKCECCGKPF